MELKTPLYDTHVMSKGKMVSFAGYLLPVQYETGVIAEHMAVRTACGLFDVSHMGELELTGPDSKKNLNNLLTNDYSQMYDGQARYSPMCNENGGVVDDLIVYKVEENHYFIVVNASNRDKDFVWIKDHIFGDVKVTDISSKIAQIALQGPKAMGILEKIIKKEDIPEKYYSCKFNRIIDGMNCIISRTGYTGEDGVEIYTDSKNAVRLWELLMKAGAKDGLIPCGLGARDTLRLEAAMPLYGHEMNDTISPIEAGLGFFVKMEKLGFIGKKALEDDGMIRRKRVGLKVTGRGIAREQALVYAGEKQVGITTSGTHCPFLGYPVAMGLLEIGHTEIGTEVEIEVRGKRIAAEVTALPFYKRLK